MKRPLSARVRPPAAAACLLDKSSRPRSLYLQPAGARGRRTPEPSPAHSGPRGRGKHTGRPTCFDLSSALGPLGPPPISSGTSLLAHSAPSAPQPERAPQCSQTHTHSGTYTVHINKETNIIQASHTASCKHNLSHTAM